MPNPLLPTLRNTTRTLAALTALVASLATLRSFRTNDFAELLTPAGAYQSNSAQGFLQFQLLRTPNPEPKSGFLRSATPDPFQSPQPFLDETLYGRHLISIQNYLDGDLLGFRLCIATRRESTRYLLQLPEWSIAATALLACYALRHRTPLDPAARPCFSCGYDTRANPTSCSECGTSLLPLSNS